MQMKHYLESAEAVFTEVNSSEAGLTTAEATARLEKNGKNKLAEAKKDSTLKKFFDQMKDPMIIILLIAAVVSAVVEMIEAKGFVTPTDSIIILVVVLINAILGVIQENKAEKAVEALQKMSAATTKTLRDGKVETIKSEDLVVGDYKIVETKAPEGYQLLTEPVVFSLPSGDEKVESLPLDQEFYISQLEILHMPSSGGYGALPYIITGLSIAVAGAGAVYVLLKGKKKDN